jgi:transporter family protein
MKIIQVYDWLIYALISAFLYGLWAIFSKLATNYINPHSILFYEGIGFLVPIFIVLAKANFTLSSDIRGIIYAILVGITGAVATLFLFVALSKGHAFIIVPITALYPIFTILMAYFILKEPIAFQQIIGLVFALVAVVMLTYTK